MAEKRIPLRKCIGCNEMKEKKQLIRIVKNAQGEISVDPAGKLPGRGAYICKSVDCFDTAFKSKRLERAFKGKIPDEVYSTLRDSLSLECTKGE